MFKIDTLERQCPSICKTDAATAIFQRQLESIESRVYRFKKTQLRYREFIPVSNEDNPGAIFLTYRMYEQTGAAKIIADYSTDIPSCDVYGQEFTIRVYPIATKMIWSFQELDAGNMANISIIEEKTSACKRVMSEEFNRITWSGDDEYGIVGLLNNPNVTEVTAATKTATGTAWANATPNEIIADVRTMVRTVDDQSNGVWQMDTLLLPRDQYVQIGTTSRSEDNDKTIKEYLMTTDGFGITTIAGIVELANAFTGGTEDGAVGYANDPEVLTLKIPMEPVLHAPQEKDLTVQQIFEARYGGVVVRHPLGMVYLVGI